MVPTLLAYFVCLRQRVSDEVKTDIAAAIHMSGLKGFKRFMKKNNLGAFYVPANAEKAQEAMYTAMVPIMEKLTGK